MLALVGHFYIGGNTGGVDYSHYEEFLVGSIVHNSEVVRALELDCILNISEGEHS